MRLPHCPPHLNTDVLPTHLLPIGRVLCYLGAFTNPPTPKVKVFLFQEEAGTIQEGPGLFFFSVLVATFLTP